MAITSLISPTGDVSVQDSLWHIAWSTASGQIDMKYVFDVFRGTEQLIRAKVYPNPTNGRGYFDASRIISNEMKYDWFNPNDVGNTGVFLLQPDNSGQASISYQIRVGEEVSGITTLNMASGNVTAYNWTPSLYNRRQVSPSQIQTSTFLTDRPYNQIRSALGERILIPYRMTSGTMNYLYINWYSKNNTPLGYGTSYQFTSNYAHNILQMDIGSNAINEYLASVEIDNNVGSYDVTCYEDGQAGGWKIAKVFLECNSKYTPILLHFVNRYGLFETARFSLVNKLVMDLEKKSYQRNEARFGTTGVTYKDANNVYYETKINHSTKYKWTYKLIMDYPTDQEYEWLEQLMYSPLVYAELEDGFYPVTIKQTNYEYIKNVYAGLRHLEVDIEMNQKRFGFKR